MKEQINEYSILIPVPVTLQIQKGKTGTLLTPFF